MFNELKKEWGALTDVQRILLMFMIGLIPFIGFLSLIGVEESWKMLGLSSPAFAIFMVIEWFKRLKKSEEEG